MPCPTPPYRIQVIPDTNLAYFRQAVIGSLRYGYDTGRLRFADRWLAHETEGDLRARITRNGIEGIIAALHTQEAEARFADLGVPVVNVSNAMTAPRCPVVTQDDVAVGRMAAAHLRACGCRAFGFWGELGRSYSEQRLSGFRTGLGEAPLFAAGTRPGKDTPLRLYERIRSFLQSLPPHCGVFATMDSYALYFLRAARELGLSVPDDLAVLGAGDDDFLVELESVPLSSLRLPAREIGYEAARLVDNMITQGLRTADSVLLHKCEVVRRRSTDAMLFEDPAVARAMRHLRDNPKARATDLVRAAGVSRSGLHQRFRKAVGRSLLEEIHHQRLAVAKELLATSDLKLAAIAERIGLASVQRFSVFFRSHVGQPPGAYRSAQNKAAHRGAFGP